MSVKLDAIDLNRGDCMFIRFEGSVENSLFVKVDEQGLCTIQGPVNVNSKTFQVTTAGVQVIMSGDELREAITKRLREGATKTEVCRELGADRKTVDAIDHYIHAPADAE